MMSLGDETAVNQHGPTMNNVTPGQRTINCTSIQSSVAPTVVLPVKQNAHSGLPGNNRSINKPGSIGRTRVDRSLSKQDGFDTEDVAPSTLQRMRNNSKVKVLQRSHAMREETSPPRESETSHFTSNNSNMSGDKIYVHKTVNGIYANSTNKMGNTSTKANYLGGNSLQVNNNLNRPNSKHKLRHQGSSQGSADSSSPCLSRDSSTEQYTDNSGIDLSQFIADTINRNIKDRMFLLQIEQDLLSLQKYPKGAYQKFPVMPSYQRMLVHRVAAFFGMDHNVDQTGSCVIVKLTPSTRIPDIRFSDLIRQDGKFSEEPKRCILKRDSNSFEEGTQIRSPERQLSGDSRRSKSFEEREEDYERARKRIFNRDDGMVMNSLYRGRDDNSRRNSQEEKRWQGESQPWSSSDSELCNSKVRQSSGSRSSRIAKVESFEGRDTLKANSLKGSVAKSYSFGGYPNMSRGDNSTSSSRALTKQDSVTSTVSSTRLSPSSSGYKSQSTRSDVTPSSRSSPNQTTSQCSFSPEPNTVLWAVSSLNAVPPGAVLINPVSGQPYTNPDGSLYRYDPENPIKLCPTIEEDVMTNSVSSPKPGANASDVECSEHVIPVKANADNSKNHADAETSKVTNNKPEMNLRNSSTSPSLPELSPEDTAVSKNGAKQAEPANEENSDRKGSPSVDGPQIETEPNQLKNAINSNDNNSNNEISNNNNKNANNNNDDDDDDDDNDNDDDNDDNNTNNNNNNNSNSNNNITTTTTNNNNNNNNSSNNNNNNNNNNSIVESLPTEVAQANFNVIESENGYNDNGGNSACQNETREYPGRNNPVTYHLNYPSNCNVQTDYGSQTANNGAFANTSVGVPPINYSLGAQYPTEPLHMPPEAAMYPQQVVYGSTAQGNPYGVLHTAPSAPTSNYEVRPGESNPTMGVPELGNYFMGLNINSEQAPPAATPAPQFGYWSPSPNTSQTQGSNHSSQIQVYYVPGNVSSGTIHPKYTPAAPSMYTYNVPPMVYPTEICQSVMPSATNTVFPAPYYSSASNTAVTYRAPTPPTPTPTAVAATAMAPTSFFLYHPQPAPPPPPPPQVQFGMVRPQQQVPGIRSSPPPGPRARIPHTRSISDRTRHPMNVESKAASLHFSSPLSIYGLRFMTGEIQSIGMVRPLGNLRPIAPNSSHAQFTVASQSSGSESLISTMRVTKPRKR